MAVVVVVIIGVTAPLVFMQRLPAPSQRYVSVRGKGQKTQPLSLHGWRWFAFAAIVLWLLVTVAVPLVRHHLRSFVVTWGEGVELARRADARSLPRNCSTIPTSCVASSTHSASA